MKEASQSLLPYLCVTSICETRGREGSTSNFSRAEQVGPPRCCLGADKVREPSLQPHVYEIRESFSFRASDLKIYQI